MGLWDTLTGSSQNKQQAAPRGGQTTLQEPTDVFTPTPFDPTTAQDVSSFLGGPGGFDPSSLHPLAGLNKDTLDYLTIEDATLSQSHDSDSILPSRGWSDDLCYGTGVTYLSAVSVGGAWGLAEGLSRSPASAPPKLRLNSVLNAVTRRGPFLGNSAGVVAMIYNIVNSSIGAVRGKHDSANSVLAGLLSGILFKSTKGIRPMMTSGLMVAGLAGAWTVSLALVSI